MSVGGFLMVMVYIVYMEEQRKPLKTSNTRLLTDKELAFINAKKQGMSNGKAAIAAGMTKNAHSARVIGHKVSKDMTIQEAVAEALAANGITLDKAIAPIADGLKAEKTVIIGNGEQAMADNIPDHSIRLKASGMALNLMGAMNKNEGATSLTFVKVIVGDKTEYSL
jgi:osmotically-inducible protein OsmY